MSIKTGQQATTTSAAPLPAASITSGPVTLKAPSSNAAPIEIGGSGVTVGTGFVMNPGDLVQVSVQNLSNLYLIGANTSDKITWIGI